MDQFLSVGRALGLRHLLEDAIAVLAGQLQDLNRKNLVIRDLSHLLKRASRGRELSERDHGQFTVRPGDVSAFEAFSLFSRYLNDVYNGELSSKIEGTYAILSRLEKQEAVDATESQSATSFLSQLLERLRRDETYGRQCEPEVVRLP